ncbi:Fic family protein [Candidatus Woesearchaeota archaeon]|nr:Fic family protein [Candidatus Woesearchaeota archaeon]
MVKTVFQRITEKKKELDSLRPLEESQISKLIEENDIDYIYNSVSIEGNTLTLNETRFILEKGITIGGKNLREHLDVTNQKEAMTWIREQIKKKITEADILILHRITLKGISDYWAGKYKTSQNRILGSKLKTTLPHKVQSEMHNLVQFMQKPKGTIVDIVVFVHHELVRIHPFVDGNGRVARLLVNLVLIKNGYPPIIIKNQDRKRYFDSLEKAHFGNMGPFRFFMALAVESSLNMYLNALKSTNKKNEMLSLNDLSKEVEFSQEYLSLLARIGKLSATKINGVWHSTRKDLNEYMDSRN